MSWFERVCVAVGLCAAQYIYWERYPDGTAFGARWYSKAGCEREIVKFKASQHQKGARAYCERIINVWREEEVS